MPLLRSAFGDDALVLRESDFRLLLLSTAFPILGTALVSPILDAVIEPFGATPANIGLMISFLTAPAIVVIPISGVLADRYGRRLVLVVALLLFGAGGTAIALTTDFRIVLALRFLQGVGFGGIVPIITASIGDMYDGSEEVTAQGLRMMVNGTSGTAFPLLAGALVAVGWRYPFLLYAAAFPVAAAVYLRFVEPTDDAADGTGERDGPAYRHALLAIVRRRRVSSLLIARTLPLLVWVGFLTYNSLVVVRIMGGTAFQAGVLVAVGNLAFAAAASQVGRILSLFGTKFSALVAANLSLIAGFVGFLLAPGVRIAALWIALAGAGFGVCLPLYRSYLTELAPESLRAGVVSLGAAGGRVTATVTPIAMGLAIEAATPLLGETGALRLAGIGVAIVGGGGGIVCLVVASASPSVPDDRAELVRD